MPRRLREGLGYLLVLLSLGALGGAIVQMTLHDYLATIVLALTGLSILGAGMELLRPFVGE